MLSILFDLADLLNVRLQTLGVAEHSFDIELCGSRYNWLMYDVGGAVRLYLFLPLVLLRRFSLFSGARLVRNESNRIFLMGRTTSVTHGYPTLMMVSF